MFPKIPKPSNLQGKKVAKACIVKVTRLSRPDWLPGMTSLPPTAQLNAYADKLSKFFSSPTSELTITPPIALPRTLYGVDAELMPIACTITHINFVAEDLRLVLHSSTKKRLLAVYNHFLKTAPMAHAVASMKDLLRQQFIQYMEAVKWKTSSNLIKYVDKEGCCDILSAYKIIVNDQGNEKCENRWGSTPPSTDKFTMSLEAILEGAVEVIKSLFAPGLPARVPVNIWGIPWIVSAEDILIFNPDANEECEQDEDSLPMYSIAKPAVRGRGRPVKRRMDEAYGKPINLPIGEIDQSSDDLPNVVTRDDEILDMIVVASSRPLITGSRTAAVLNKSANTPFRPVTSFRIISRLQKIVQHLDVDFLQLYTARRMIYENSHPPPPKKVVQHESFEDPPVAAASSLLEGSNADRLIALTKTNVQLGAIFNLDTVDPALLAPPLPTPQATQPSNIPVVSAPSTARTPLSSINIPYGRLMKGPPSAFLKENNIKRPRSEVNSDVPPSVKRLKAPVPDSKPCAGTKLPLYAPITTNCGNGNIVHPSVDTPENGGNAKRESSSTLFASERDELLDKDTQLLHHTRRQLLGVNIYGYTRRVAQKVGSGQAPSNGKGRVSTGKIGNVGGNTDFSGAVDMEEAIQTDDSTMESEEDSEMDDELTEMGDELTEMDDRLTEMDACEQIEDGEEIENDEEIESGEESDESDSEHVQLSQCHGGKFKSGFKESSNVRKHYYL